MIRDWREELVRIGTTIYSNADTESKNHFLRLLAADSRGLESEMLRARLQLADDHGRSERWPSCFDSVKGRIHAPRVFDFPPGNSPEGPRRIAQNQRRERPQPQKRKGGPASRAAGHGYERASDKMSEPDTRGGRV